MSAARDAAEASGGLTPPWVWIVRTIVSPTWLPEALITIGVERVVERPESVVIVVRRLHPLDVLRERRELFLGQSRGRHPRHLLLEDAAHRDQVVEEGHVTVVMVVFERDPNHRRVEQVPRIALLHRRAAPLLDTNESPLLELLETLADHRPAEAELLAERGLRREDAPLREGCPR